jgi:hypothetical protein
MEIPVRREQKDEAFHVESNERNGTYVRAGDNRGM